MSIIVPQLKDAIQMMRRNTRRWFLHTPEEVFKRRFEMRMQILDDNPLPPPPPSHPLQSKKRVPSPSSSSASTKKKQKKTDEPSPPVEHVNPTPPSEEIIVALRERIKAREECMTPEFQREMIEIYLKHEIPPTPIDKDRNEVSVGIDDFGPWTLLDIDQRLNQLMQENLATNMQKLVATIAVDWNAEKPDEKQ